MDDGWPCKISIKVLNAKNIIAVNFGAPKLEAMAA